MPKKIDVRITTSVVAYTSLRVGQVTRPTSLRTSARNRRDRPHQPVTLSRARPLNDSSCSAVIDFIAFRSLRSPLLVARDPLLVVRCSSFVARCSLTCARTNAQRAEPNWQDRRESNPQPPVLETGALPIELLSF